MLSVYLNLTWVQKSQRTSIYSQKDERILFIVLRWLFCCIWLVCVREHEFKRKRLLRWYYEHTLIVRDFFKNIAGPAFFFSARPIIIDNCKIIIISSFEGAISWIPKGTLFSSFCSFFCFVLFFFCCIFYFFKYSKESYILVERLFVLVLKF